MTTQKNIQKWQQLERERCIAAVLAEPECPGEMPDEMWLAICSDRDATTKAFQIAVRKTKEEIIKRIVESADCNELAWRK